MRARPLRGRRVDLRLLTQPVHGLGLTVREAEDGSAALLHLARRRRLRARGDDHRLAASHGAHHRVGVGDVADDDALRWHAALHQRGLRLLRAHHANRRELGTREHLAEDGLAGLAAGAADEDLERGALADAHGEDERAIEHVVGRPRLEMARKPRGRKLADDSNF